MHRDKGNTADSRNWTAVFEYSEKVGTNGTLVHDVAPATELAEVQAKGCP
jgi:hypothetical protein